MGRLFLIEYDSTSGVEFFMCRVCRAHIAMDHELIFTHEAADWCAIFENPVNVLTEEGSVVSELTEAGVLSWENVHCVRCNAKLGRKFVEVPEPTDAIRNGRFQMNLRRLFYWDGNELVDGYTRVPIAGLGAPVLVAEHGYYVQEPEDDDDDEEPPELDNAAWQAPGNANPMQAPHEDAEGQPPVNVNPVQAHDGDAAAPMEAPAQFENAEGQPPENANPVQAHDEDAAAPMEAPAQFENAEGQPPVDANPVQVHDEDAAAPMEAPAQVENAEGQSPVNANPVQAHDEDIAEPMEAPAQFENAEGPTSGECQSSASA